MDFGALPPEINSGRMYAGPGSTPLLSAASAWDALAAELGSAATSYGSVINGLAEEAWLGRASAAMAIAASPYVRWMSATAAEAERTAGHARAAAAAYEAAFAATVPPAVVAANRNLLAALVATNVMGQNTAAIAAADAFYGEMWAQDATAMYGYAGSSAIASTVTPFRSPPPTTNAAGTASQGSAVSQAAAGTSSSAGAQSVLSQVVSTVPPTLQSLASPVQSATPSSILSDIGAPLGLASGDVSNALSNLASSSFTPMSLAGISQFGADLSVIHALNAGAVPGADASGVAGGGVAAIGAVGPTGAANLGGAPVSAAVGRATLVAKMSVPQGWAAAAPAVTSAGGSLPAAAEGWAIPPGAGMAEMAPPAGVPGMPGAPGGGLTNKGYGFAAPRYGFRPTVVTRPPAAG